MSCLLQEKSGDTGSGVVEGVIWRNEANPHNGIVEPPEVVPLRSGGSVLLTSEPPGPPLERRTPERGGVFCYSTERLMKAAIWLRVTTSLGQ